MLVHHEPDFTLKAVDRADRLYTVSMSFFNLVKNATRFAISKTRPDMHLFITIYASASIVVGELEYVGEGDDDSLGADSEDEQIPYPNNFVDEEFLKSVDPDEADAYKRLAVPSIFHSSFGNVWLAGIHCPEFTYSSSMEEPPVEMTEGEWRKLMVSHVIYHVLHSASGGNSYDDDAILDKRANELAEEFFEIHHE